MYQGASYLLFQELAAKKTKKKTDGAHFKSRCTKWEEGRSQHTKINEGEMKQ